MRERIDLPARRRQLLLEDGQRSMLALERSLASDQGCGAEASLHVMDLSSLFSGLGLKLQAHALRDLAQGLSEDAVTAPSQVQLVLPLTKRMLEAIQTADETAIDAARSAWDVCFAQGEPAASGPEALPPQIRLQPAVAEFFITGREGYLAADGGRWMDAAPLFSAGLTSAPYAAAPVKTPVTARPSVQYPPDWMDVRAQAVQMVQEAGVCVHAQKDTVAQMVIKLNAVQDALMRVGQLPLRQAYPDLAVDDCWADPHVLDLLEHLQVFSQRAVRISVSMRNLMLFVFWQGSTLSHVELAHLGQKVADLHGRVDLLDTGVQLVLPVSAMRMRMVSFQVGGQWHALSQAQFREWKQDGTNIQLQLRCGVQDQSLSVAQSGPFASMNLYPWPALVPAPIGLQAVALDGMGRIHLVHHYAS